MAGPTAFRAWPAKNGGPQSPAPDGQTQKEPDPLGTTFRPERETHQGAAGRTHHGHVEEHEELRLLEGEVSRCEGGGGKLGSELHHTHLMPKATEVDVIRTGRQLLQIDPLAWLGGTSGDQ